MDQVVIFYDVDGVNPNIPRTQMHPLRVIVSLRPSLSPKYVVAKAPTKEPAGMDATIAPCTPEVGWLKYERYEGFYENQNLRILSLASKIDAPNW